MRSELFPDFVHRYIYSRKWSIGTARDVFISSSLNVCVGDFDLFCEHISSKRLPESGREGGVSSYEKDTWEHRLGKISGSIAQEADHYNNFVPAARKVDHCKRA